MVIIKNSLVAPRLTALVAVLILVLGASFGVALADGYTQQPKLTAGDGAAGDWFGWSISISGDTMVVAAPADDDNGTDSGSVYVFQRSGSSWSQQAKLTASDGAAGDLFGNSIAIDEDTMVVGARRDDDDGTDSGAAYVFVRSGGSWSQ